MSQFDDLLSTYTAVNAAESRVHGVLAKCVDKHGNVIYSKISGYASASVDASPLGEDAVFKIVSASKLITSIALLQCVEKGLIGLDESLAEILPELKCQIILEEETSGAGELILRPSQTNITPRHLLTHTSGLNYQPVHPLLLKWSQTTDGQRYKGSRHVVERFNYPLLFEPGAGWTYGAGIEWAGVVVRRLNRGMSLDEYMVDNIWKKVGLTAPHPTFHISKDAAYKARLMSAAERALDGSLQPYEFEFGDAENPDDHAGGAGLVVCAKDYLAVLADLISDRPKLLTLETISLMLTPQLPLRSKALEMLLQQRSVWDIAAGPVLDNNVNHGLGGLLVLSEATELGQPSNLLTWRGALNTVWFLSRELGVAGFFSTQITPFGDAAVRKLIDAWKKDFWSQFRETT